ncbi:P-loop containing nucleoside triphosphate hydrolase protein [Rhizophagus irregularis]|uniref:DNA 3'-5' helicase n=1 Tax=Rhizophagus irregularis TaxID=588596 RepID=A0A2N0QTZ1_9GLOM|nr:P-loop containing nucleoside triphosphate hydrolase protein [Rhizophagus irregularis]
MAIEKRNQTKAEKIINQKKNLETFDFTQDLVPYGRQVYKELNKSKFIPSFANLVPSFKTSCLKCIGYQSFAKKYSSGLCNLCGFLLKNNLPSSLPKLRNQQASSSSSCRELAISSIVQFFGFERYRELQCESIESFLSEQNTLTILRTGRGKSLIYAAASILSQALTVVFTPQKSLMDNQREMVKFGIPAAMLYASSEQSPQVQEKIVSEIASRKIRQKSKVSEYATKYIRGLQFVIDETHCIISYEGFQDSWHQLKCIKQDFPSVPLLALTATCSPEDAAKIETVLKRPNMKVIRSPIIHHNHEGRVIIFSATIQHCIDITDELRKAFDPSIVAMYHGKMSSSE